MHACLPVPFKHANCYQSVQGKWACTKALKGKRNEGGLHNRRSTNSRKRVKQCDFNRDAKLKQPDTISYLQNSAFSKLK